MSYHIIFDSIATTIRLQAYHIEYIIAFPLLFSFDPCTFQNPYRIPFSFFFFVKHNSKYILYYFFVSCRKEKSNTENYRSESMRVEIERRKQNSKLSQLFFFFFFWLFCLGNSSSLKQVPHFGSVRVVKLYTLLSFRKALFIIPCN